MKITARTCLALGSGLFALGAACSSTLDLGGNHHTTSSGGTGGTGGASTTATASTSSGGGAGGSTATTTSTGSACVPQSTAPCYDGPIGTEGVGICKAGVMTCNADGMAYGPCTGEVKPKPEDCATPQDEDCDGLAPACKGNILWSERFGDASDQVARNVAVDGLGNVFVTGNFSGTINFGGGTLMSAGGDDIFLAKLDPNGAHVWSKRFGDGGSQVGYAVSTDGAGNVVVTGAFSGTVDFGNGPLVSSGGDDVFVAKLDPSGGPIWSRRFGDLKGQSAIGVAIDGSDSVLVTGYFSGTLDFGGGPLLATGTGDIFAAKLDASGNHVWSKRFGGGTDQHGSDIAVDSLGNAVLTGYFFGGAVDFGGGPLTNAGSADAFLAKLDASGGHVWSKHFGDSGTQVGTSVAVAGTGNVVVTGYFNNTADFGGGPLVSSGGADLFVAKLDASGNYAWSKRFGDVADQNAINSAVDTGGNVLLVGAFSGLVDFGGGWLPSAGGTDVFLAKLDASGEHVWSRRVGDSTDSQVGTSVAADSAGNMLAAGYFSGTLDFGQGPLKSAGGSDIFVSKIAP
jgi:Beta-propeller repeat